MVKTDKVLVIEEVDAFLEGNLKELTTDMKLGGAWTFYGKASGHIPSFGEINPDIVINGIASALGLKYASREPEHDQAAQEVLKKYALPRETQFCAGCPYRPVFWAIKDALKLDGREGVVTGDIGCYGSAVGSTGFYQLKTMHSMGSGMGVAVGLGKMGQFGSDQPVLATCGDSTFFHAAIPALMEGVHGQSNFILIFLDNGGTAMTGFQPHPGSNKNAVGEPASAIDFERLCEALGLRVEIVDSYDVKGLTEKLLNMLEDRDGPKVLVCRRECALMKGRREKPPFSMRIASERCLGETCGCDRFCTRVFRCPGLIWDRNAQKASIDEAICVGCGVCVDICPHSAIIREDN